MTKKRLNQLKQKVIREQQKAQRRSDKMQDDCFESCFERALWDIENEAKFREAREDYYTASAIYSYEHADWENVISCVAQSRAAMEYVFTQGVYDRMPDEYKFDFVIKCYTHGGDSIPAVREAVKDALKYGEPNLPEDFDDVITVYRAGDESIEDTASMISWTTDKEQAIWFIRYSGFRKKKPMHLYKGTIRRDQIITFCDDRNEKEVIQYGSIKNIELLATIPAKDVEELYGASDPNKILSKYGLALTR